MTVPVEGARPIYETFRVPAANLTYPYVWARIDIGTLQYVPVDNTRYATQRCKLDKCNNSNNKNNNNNMWSTTR